MTKARAARSPYFVIRHSSFVIPFPSPGRRQDRVFHPVQQLLVRRADGRQRAAELGLVGDEEIVRAEADAAAHGGDLRGRGVEVRLLVQAPFVEALQEVWVMLEG